MLQPLKYIHASKEIHQIIHLVYEREGWVGVVVVAGCVEIMITV